MIYRNTLLVAALAVAVLVAYKVYVRRSARSADASRRAAAAIQSEENYRTCTCPTYPRGNYSCYGVCTNAYERGKSCAAPTLLQDCKADGDRCRTVVLWEVIFISSGVRPRTPGSM